MFKVKIENNNDKILATVKLRKRILSREPIIFVYTKDVLKEVMKEYPELKLKEQNYEVISNTKEPHEATWEFKIEKEKKTSSTFKNKKAKQAQTEKFNKEVPTQEADRFDLTEQKNCDSMEETSKDLKDLLVQETTE